MTDYDDDQRAATTTGDIDAGFFRIYDHDHHDDDCCW